LLLLLEPALGRADQPPTDEPSAADVEHEPVPGAETGRTDPPAKDSTLRNLGQGLLSIPRYTLEVAFAPARGGIWAFERYRVRERYQEWFSGDGGTYGLYPMLRVDSLYAPSVGLRFLHRDLLGERERLEIRGATGGEYRSLIDARLRSGQRFGSAAAEARGELQRRPADPFHGVGNADGATKTRFRREVLRATAGLDFRLSRFLHVRPTGAITKTEFARSDDGLPIDEVYGEMITGFTGASSAYGELELRWDSRRHTLALDQHAGFDRGLLIAAYAGPVRAIEGAGNHWRFGGDVQHILLLGRGPRRLVSRLHFSTVTGSYQDVPFTELPSLGGRDRLRGYERDRFRDRTAALGALDYEWDLSRYLMASLYVDAGRVFPSVSALELDGLRVGYGTSLQLHQQRRFIASINVSTSIDGGVFFDVAFDPIFHLESRLEQK
jgi:hypothetical protein